MLKTKTKVVTVTTGIIILALAFVFSTPQPQSSAAECDDPSCNTTFEVNVRETLAVTLSTDYSQSTGNINEFLRNKISLSVSTNNANGFAASMYPTNSALKNAIDDTKTLPTWTGSTGYACGSSSACSNFPANKWGYSINDNSSYAGTYYAMTGTSANPTSVLTSSGSSGSKDIYFGAKANMEQASGTYLGTVIISVVSGTTSPTTPTDPALPTDDNPGDNTGTPDNINDRTVYTTISSSGTGPSTITTTTTQVTQGATSVYASPQGESKYTESNIADGSQLATGLAVASSVAAASGLVFFILAKRRDDDDDEEEEPQA